MSYNTFEANGAAPPTVNLTGFTTNAWNTEAPSQLSSFGNGLAFLLYTNNAGDTVGIRQTGSSFNVTGSIANQQGFLMVPIDASGRFDFWLGATNHAPVLNILGALPSSDFIANTPTAVTINNSYQTQNLNTIAGYPSSAVAALMLTTSAGMDFRLPTSSDTFKDTNETATLKTHICPLDASVQFAASCSLNGQTAYACGYFTSSSGLQWHDPKVAVNPAAAGSNQNIAQAPTDPSTGVLANIYDWIGSINNTYILQIQGGTYATNRNSSGNRHQNHVVAAPSMINQGSITSTTLYERGFFGAPVSYALHSNLEF